MSNGQVCCALGICCPPARQRASIAKSLVGEGLSQDDADKAAAWFEGELSSLGDLEAAVSRMTREHKDKGGA